jgi:hypothetical protein
MNMNCKPKCGKIFLLVVLGIAALSWVVMALWNWLVPALFAGGHEISYVQAMGVLLLSKILFGCGFRGNGCWKNHCRQRGMENMTPEEREKFRAGMRGWCNKAKPD